MTKKTKQTKLNVRLIRRIQKHILAEPRRFFMGWFVAKGKKNRWEIGGREGCFGYLGSDLAETIPPCKTAACIAGWANIMTGAKGIRSIANPARASKVLGMGRDQELSGRLFSLSGWPEKYFTRYDKARSPLQRAKAAVARLDHLIKTGK